MFRFADSLDRSARVLAADPQFEAAAVSFTESFVNWRRALNGFNKVVASGARQRIMRAVLGLHFGNSSNNPDDGATFERLLARSNPEGETELCGPRVLRTVIALALHSGHLSVQQGSYDRRLKIFRPTDKWLAQEAERHKTALQSLALLERDGGGYGARPRGTELVSRLAAFGGRHGRAVGVALGEPNGAMGSVAALDGGLATAFAVADAWGRGKRVPSHKEIGASFRLSASQARKILRLAADRALVAFDRDGKIADAAGLMAETRRLIACEFALYARGLGAVEGSAESIPAAAFLGERPVQHAI